MAKQRMVNTEFWKDEYVQELNPSEKLLFLYFITNESTSICGIYKISLRTMSFDTGIQKDNILKIIDKFFENIHVAQNVKIARDKM